jgi:hypothetical protein
MGSTLTFSVGRYCTPSLQYIKKFFTGEIATVSTVGTYRPSLIANVNRVYVSYRVSNQLIALNLNYLYLCRLCQNCNFQTA